MKITPQFILDMNICVEANAWYLSTFGATEQTYQTVYNQVVNYAGPGDPNGWLAWAKSLQTRLAAIVYYNNETYLNVFQLKGNGITEQYLTVLECQNRIDSYIAIAVTPATILASVTIQLMTTTTSGVTISDYNSAHTLASNESLMINTLTIRKTATSAAGLQLVLDELLVAEQTAIRANFVISQKVSEPVDGFFAWKPL